MPNDAQLNVHIDPELLARLKIVAARKRKSVSEIVRDFIAWYVEKEERDE